MGDNKGIDMGGILRRRMMSQTSSAESKYITFQDDAVFSILMEKGVSSDGIGITKEDAAAVATIYDWFTDNTDIAYFRELKYFTGLSVVGGTNYNKEAEKAGFYGCSNLVAVTLPESIKTIGTNAFRNCYSLIECNIPKSVTAIYQRAFSYVPAPLILDCQNLLKLYDDGSQESGVNFIESGIEEIISIGKVNKIFPGWDWQGTQFGTFSRCKNLKKANLVGVDVIGKYNFRECERLQELIVSAREIGLTAFARCSALEKLTFTNPVEKIEQYAFGSSGTFGKGLRIPMAAGTSMDVGAFDKTAVRRILDLGELSMTLDGFWNNTTDLAGAFSRNVNLELIIFPPTMTRIGSYTLACYNGVLNTIVCKAATPPTLGTAALGGSSTRPTLTYIYVPDESVSAYKSASGWSDYASLIRGISQFATEQPEVYSEINQYL